MLVQGLRGCTQNFLNKTTGFIGCEYVCLETIPYRRKHPNHLVVQVLRLVMEFFSSFFQPFKHTLYNTFKQAIGPGVLETFSTCAVKHKDFQLSKLPIKWLPTHCAVEKFCILQRTIFALITCCYLFTGMHVTWLETSSLP